MYTLRDISYAEQRGSEVNGWVIAGWVRAAFEWWRGIIKAEACFRRMRLRATLSSWTEHIATRRHWAERLRGATNILMFGSLARTFSAWHNHARVSIGA